ncbi:calcium-activated chloride channel regulator 1-like [Penaeus chinensis]|uniref:calcium-activated chloride channel regulator 1-like n=1 Tax=Penaeus chinensis TaxID=139456 RepID=UPI001FB65C53|nr:calcium-activated chloride channel regulator 1-like [Penaeus chinensis]
MKEAEPASCHLFSSPHDALAAAALTARGRRGGRPEEVVGAGRSPRTHHLSPSCRFLRAALTALLLVSMGVLSVAGEPSKASELRPALPSGIGGTAGAVKEAVDAPNFHRKRDNSWYGGERKDPPLQLKIESSVRTYPSRATSPEGARGATGPSYASYGKAKWGQDLSGGGGVRATYNSLPKGHDRTTTTVGADDLSDRQKRTEAQKGADGGTPSKYSSHLVLKDGAYEGLVVEVNDRISQDDCRTVIDGIQTVLTSWSTGLYTATDGGLSLRSAMVLLPSHWSTRACHPPASSRPPAPPTQPAHMLISPPHPVFADAPWTQQSGGCGRQGNFIQMGVGFLESANTSSAHAVRAASQLVGEWGKYRWGLFSEAGYAGDNLYLPWYRQGPDWAATVCTDAHAGPPPCHPDHAHHCSWPPEAHRNATSSLLSLPNLPQVTKFCDSKTHNREAPTKQNVLCGRRSAWEVMLEHPDFKAK